MKIYINIIIILTLSACNYGIKKSQTTNNNSVPTPPIENNGGDGGNNNGNNNTTPAANNASLNPNSMVNQLKDVDNNYIINNINSKLDNMSIEDIEAKDNDNNSIWHLLAKDSNNIHNQQAIIEKLSNKTKKDINSKNNNGETPLDIIVKNKFFISDTALKKMLDNGAETSFDLKEYLSKNNSYLLKSVISNKKDLEDYLKHENYLKELINSNNAGNNQISNFYAHISRISEDARKLLADKLLEYYKEDENYKNIIGEYKDIEPINEYDKKLKKMFLSPINAESAGIYEDFTNQAKKLVLRLEYIAEQKKKQEEERLENEQIEQEQLRREQEKTEKLTKFQNDMKELFENILNINNLEDSIKKILPINTKINIDELYGLHQKYIKTNQILENLKKAKLFAENEEDKNFIENFIKNKNDLADLNANIINKKYNHMINILATRINEENNKNEQLIIEGNKKDNFREWQSNLDYANDFETQIKNIEKELTEKYDELKKSFENFTNNIEKKLKNTLS